MNKKSKIMTTAWHKCSLNVMSNVALKKKMMSSSATSLSQSSSIEVHEETFVRACSYQLCTLTPVKCGNVLRITNRRGGPCGYCIPTQGKQQCLTTVEPPSRSRLNRVPGPDRRVTWGSRYPYKRPLVGEV